MGPVGDTSEEIKYVQEHLAGSEDETGWLSQDDIEKLEELSKDADTWARFRSSRSSSHKGLSERFSKAYYTHVTMFALYGSTKDRGMYHLYEDSDPAPEDQINAALSLQRKEVVEEILEKPSAPPNKPKQSSEYISLDFLGVQALVKLRRLLKNLEGHKDAAEFRRPVEIEEYKRKIKNPVSLSEIIEYIRKERLMGRVPSKERIMEMLVLMRNNCFRFNGPNNIYSDSVLVLEEYWMDALRGIAYVREPESYMDRDGIIVTPFEWHNDSGTAGTESLARDESRVSREKKIVMRNRQIRSVLFHAGSARGLSRNLLNPGQETIRRTLLLLDESEEVDLMNGRPKYKESSIRETGWIRALWSADNHVHRIRFTSYERVARMWFLSLLKSEGAKVIESMALTLLVDQSLEVATAILKKIDGFARDKENEGDLITALKLIKRFPLKVRKDLV